MVSFKRDWKAKIESDRNCYTFSKIILSVCLQNISEDVKAKVSNPTFSHNTTKKILWYEYWYLCKSRNVIAHYSDTYHLRCKYRFIWITYTKKREVRRANSENEESIFVYVSAYTVHSDSARHHSLLELEKFDCSIRTIERPVQRVDIGRRLFN